MPTNGSARSVYSTRSHLLSPRSSAPSSSPPAHPRVPFGSSSSSLYPSSLQSNDDLISPSAGVAPRHKVVRRKKSNVKGRHAPAQNRPRYPTTPLASSAQQKHTSADDTAPGLVGISRARSLGTYSAECSPSASRSPIPVLTREHCHRSPFKSPFIRAHGPRERIEHSGRATVNFTDDAQSDRSHAQDLLSEVIMAIDVDKEGKVGCAYYLAVDEALVPEEDISMGAIEAVNTFLLHVQPTSVLIPNRAPGDLIEFLEQNAHRFDDEGSSVEQGSYILRHLVSAQFDYEAGKEALAKVDLGPSKPDPVQVLSLGDEPAQCIASSSHYRLMRLAENINLESYLSIGCAGAVLNELERRRAVEDQLPAESGDVAFRVLTIKMNSSADTMLVSADSLLSLQILQSELHPNPQTRSSNSSEPKAKESLSVSGLLQALASSAQGKRKLRQMLLRPSTDLGLIQERQASIAALLRPDNAEIVKHMRKQLRRLKDTKTLLLHVRKGVDRVRGLLSVRIGDWKALLRFAMVSAQLKQATNALSGTSDISMFSRIRTEIDVRRFLLVGDLIIRTIDFVASKESGHTEIHSGVSECLDELRREFFGVCRLLPDWKDSVVREIPPEAAKYIRHCTIMPQLGFLVAVQLDHETREGVYHGQSCSEGEWMICFASEDTAYYKNQLMLDLDSQYGDLPSRILDEEIEVIMALAAAVLEHEEAILSASELFGELDSLLALALAAEKYNWVAPTMTAANVIDIAGGRHPLQELLVPSYIPNDCAMAGGCGTGGSEEGGSSANKDGSRLGPSMMILTGPNNSGKSVYMKQVALIVYLAHTGSYVPATRATVGVTDRILTRIATRETVVNDESAFLVDVKQAAFSMNFATRRSLLLLDEFGKGTTAECGAALFAAYLKYFLDLGAERPKVLAGTHFHEVFENDVLKPGNDVAFAHMDVRLGPQAAEEVEDQVTFLYRLLPGRGSSSLGIMCAAMNDVPSDVVRRAEVIVALQERNENLVTACSELSEEDRLRLQGAELVARRFLTMQVPVPGGGNQEKSIRDILQEVLGFKGTDSF
ncbi:hypothetical protein VTK26DRAFT_7142 [Humicola hyalothermophila]